MPVGLGPIVGGNYPKDAIPVAASATGTGATVTATLPASTSAVTYISGFEITFTNPTAGASFVATLSVNPTTVPNPGGGAAINTTIGGAASLVYELTGVTAGVTIPGPPPLVVEFPNPLPAQAGSNIINNLAIQLSATAAAGTTIAINVHGFQVPYP